MAVDFKTPSEIADEYLLTLKALKPNTINTDQQDSDWWVRAQVVGGVVAGSYADQRLISNDAFPSKARHDALDRHLQTYFNRTFNAATVAVGNLLMTGASGVVVTVGQQFMYAPNSNIYQSTSTVNFGTATTGVVPVQSVVAGQAQNLFQGASLTVISPPAGANGTATVYGADISDGTDVESDSEASAEILSYIRTPLAGGKVSDYVKFAQAASTAVTGASILRYPFGFGTVGVVITSGTSDIDTALNNNETITFVPSDALVATVQAYIDTQRPVTDCVTVFKVQTLAVNVTISVRLVSGDLSTVQPGQSLTNLQLIQREVKRAVYKTPAGGRQLGPSGYVVASEIEQVVDLGLSGSVYQTGSYFQILTDRQVANLAASGPDLLILQNQQPIPGTITVNLMT